jgi:RNA polymerase sigma factor (sigma-70 family)
MKDDIHIWDQFREGDDKAFSRIFMLFSDVLYKYGLKFITDEDTVKDCIQELFIKLYDNRKSLPATDNIQFFLLKSLKNKIIDHLREDKHLVYVSPMELQFSVKYYFDPEEEISGINQDIKDKFEKVLNLLNDRQKEAIYLRYQMELSHEEIAQLLHINCQSVRNLIHRSVKKVRAEMNLSLFFLLVLVVLK